MGITGYLTDACEEWLSLLRADALKPHLTTVMKHFKEAVTDNHFLENLLHPRYKGKHLSEADEEAAWQLLLKLHPEHPQIITDLCAFTAGSDPFPSLLVSHMCWLNVACSVVDVCVKLQMQSVTTSDKHCTETTSSAMEFRCNWTCVFHCCKAYYTRAHQEIRYPTYHLIGLLIYHWTMTHL